MGRLNNCGRENTLFQCYSKEITELYGTVDAILWWFSEDDSEPANDPLWDEYAPVSGQEHLPFKIAGFMSKPNRTDQTSSPNGLDPEIDMVFKLPRSVLDSSGVPFDVEGNQVRAGDVLEIFSRGDTKYFDIVNVNRDGWVLNTDQWSTAELELKRRLKFTPERKL